MDIKKLNEHLSKFMETQIEGGDELQQVLDGTWTEEEGNNLADVVIPNINELSEEQLIQILNNAYKLDSSNSLFPSGYDADKFGPYPVKLAQALCKFNDNENLTDIYNVYYANRNVGDFADAMKVWKDYIMSGQDKDLDFMLAPIGNVEDDATQDVLMFSELYDDHKDLVRFLLNYLKEKNPELSEQIVQKMKEMV